MVINLADSFKLQEFKQVSNPNEVSRVFPKLLWILRDFSLQLKDSDQNILSMADYLEHSLKEVKGLTENVLMKNRIRKIIKDFFPNKDCICLIRPTEEETDLQEL